MNASTYQTSNSVFRALDVYNFPGEATLRKQLDSLKVLHAHLAQYPNGSPILRNTLTLDDIAARFAQMTQPVEDVEILDTAIALNIRTGSSSTDLAEIANEKQNVHNTYVNQSVLTLAKKVCSIVSAQERVVTKMKDIVQTLRAHPDWVETNMKAIKVIQSTAYEFTIGKTLREVMVAVYLRIRRAHPPPVQKELFRRFNQELQDMTGMCTTGHLSRLVNVLQGYDAEFTHGVVTSPTQTTVYSVLTDALRKAEVYEADQIRPFVLKYITGDAFQSAVARCDRQEVERAVDAFVK